MANNLQERLQKHAAEQAKKSLEQKTNVCTQEKQTSSTSKKQVLLARASLAVLFITLCAAMYVGLSTDTGNKKDPNQKLIEKQFNPLYGDHLQLKVASKNHLKFPDTYEHIETKYWDNKESKSITVKSYFNGKNAFGVPQRQCLIATYSYSGSELKAPEVCL